MFDKEKSLATIESYKMVFKYNISYMGERISISLEQ